jgi:AsmA-like protein
VVFSRKPPRQWLLWTAIGAVCLVVLGIVLAAASPYWPYSEKTLVSAIQDKFKANVQVQTFHRFYFPHPGCEADSIVLSRGQNGADGKPLAIAQKLTMTGRYADLLFRSHHIAEIRLEGLQVRIPLRLENEPSVNSGSDENNDGSKGKTSEVSIGSITADGSVLEFEEGDGKAPLKFAIHRLKLRSVAAGKAMSYDVSLRNPEPPGELESQGSFGPWQSKQIGEIPLSGTARLRGATLDKYPGIGGTLESEDKFGGTLKQVEVAGEANVADFHLKSPGHGVRVWARFQVTVNALEGEARLKEIMAKVGQSSMHVQGTVAKNARRNRRETSLDFSIQEGRVEDFLWLFNGAAKPPMSGAASCSGHVLVPGFGAGFVKNVVINGKFEISEGHFQKATQAKINALSARAQGEKIAAGSEAPEIAVETLSSEVNVQQGVAHLSYVFFEVPGARVRVQGEYNLLNHKVDLHGNLWTNATVSQDTSGIKAALLKPVDPLFKRKHAGAMVAVVVNGDIGSPHYGVELSPKKIAWKN